MGKQKKKRTKEKKIEKQAKKSEGKCLFACHTDQHLCLCFE